MDGKPYSMVIREAAGFGRAVENGRLSWPGQARSTNSGVASVHYLWRLSGCARGETGHVAPGQMGGLPYECYSLEQPCLCWSGNQGNDFTLRGLCRRLSEARSTVDFGGLELRSFASRGLASKKLRVVARERDRPDSRALRCRIGASMSRRASELSFGCLIDETLVPGSRA